MKGRQEQVVVVAGDMIGSEQCIQHVSASETAHSHAVFHLHLGKKKKKRLINILFH